MAENKGIYYDGGGKVIGSQAQMSILGTLSLCNFVLADQRSKKGKFKTYESHVLLAKKKKNLWGDLFHFFGFRAR